MSATYSPDPVFQVTNDNLHDWLAIIVDGLECHIVTKEPPVEFDRFSIRRPPQEAAK